MTKCQRKPTKIKHTKGTTSKWCFCRPRRSHDGVTQPNLVPRASFPLTSGRKTRALGATISGMRHRCRCAVSRITRIRLFPLFFHNGCSQSSRFPTAGQGERSSGNEIAHNHENKTDLQCACSLWENNFRSAVVLAPVLDLKVPSIKHGLRTADYGRGIKYGLRYKTRTEHYGLGINT